MSAAGRAARNEARRAELGRPLGVSSGETFEAPANPRRGYAMRWSATIEDMGGDWLARFHPDCGPTGGFQQRFATERGARAAARAFAITGRSVLAAVAIGRRVDS